MRFVLLFLTVLKRFEIRIEKRNERAAHEVSSENCVSEAGLRAETSEC